MHHEVSFLYEFINGLFQSLFGAAPNAEIFRVGSFALRTPHEWVPDHVLNAATVVLVLFVFGLVMKKSLSREQPGGIQQFFELAIETVRDLLHDVIGHGADAYLPMLGAFALFILFSNLFGLVFFLQPPTGNFNTNLALALTSFGYYHVQGFRHAGGKYLKHFLGPIIFLAPLFLILEPISHIARIVSLSLRLTGNIGGEHLAAGVFSNNMFPLIVPWPMMLLGIIGSIVQAFIFVMLSTVYVSGAVSDEH